MIVDIIGHWKCPHCKVWHYSAEHPDHKGCVLMHQCDCGAELCVNFVTPEQKQNPEYIKLSFSAQRFCKACNGHTEVDVSSRMPSHDDLECADCGDKVRNSERLEYKFPEISG